MPPYVTVEQTYIKLINNEAGGSPASTDICSPHGTLAPEQTCIKPIDK